MLRYVSKTKRNNRVGVISSPPQHKAALPRGCCLFSCPSLPFPPPPALPLPVPPGSPPRCAPVPFRALQHLPAPSVHNWHPLRAQAAAIPLHGNISPPKCARLSPPGHALAPFRAQAAAIFLHGNISPPKCARLPPPGHTPAPFRAQAAGIFCS